MAVSRRQALRERKRAAPRRRRLKLLFKASWTIDWEGMAKLFVSDEARKEFATLRRALDDVNSHLQTKFNQKLHDEKKIDEYFVKHPELKKKLDDEKHPELKKESDDEFRKDYWGY